MQIVYGSRNGVEQTMKSWRTRARDGVRVLQFFRSLLSPKPLAPASALALAVPPESPIV